MTLIFTLPDYETVALNPRGSVCVRWGAQLSSCRAGGRNGKRLDNNRGEAEKGREKGKREGGKNRSKICGSAFCTPCKDAQR